jgi:hypothetical protein
MEMRGAHNGGSLFGVPPTGEQVEFEQFHIVPAGEDGLGVRHWANVGVEQFLLTAATRRAVAFTVTVLDLGLLWGADFDT